MKKQILEKVKIKQRKIWQKVKVLHLFTTKYTTVSSIDKSHDWLVYVNGIDEPLTRSALEEPTKEEIHLYYI